MYEVIDGIRTLPRDAPLTALFARAGMGIGRIYYVNNVSGSSGNDGLSWSSAVDEISTAVGLSETYRALYTGTTNDYIHNTIVVQGTGEYAAPYGVLTTLPLHCDIIGLGDWVGGLGQGMVQIGAAASDGFKSTATIRGLNLFNLHISGNGTGKNALNVANFFRCRIEDCWLGDDGRSSGETVNAGIECDDSFSGCLIRHCLIGQTNGGPCPNYGLDFDSCTPGSNNLIEDNVIFGKLTGILIGLTDNWNGAVIRNNTISGINAECTEHGIYGGEKLTIANNYISAADALHTGTAAQLIGNIIVEGGTGGTETAYTAAPA